MSSVTPHYGFPIQEANDIVDLASINAAFSGIDTEVYNASMQTFKILGTYATLEALQAAVTNPAVGDMYNVGSAAPYTIYCYQTSGWLSLGAITGAGVPAGGAIGTFLVKQTATDYDTVWRVLALTGADAPTTSTAAWYVGMLYVRGSSPAEVYIATAIGTSTTWTRLALYANTQSRVLGFTDVSASTWTADSTYSALGFTYKCVLTLTGCTANHFADVVLSEADRLSGKYAGVALTGAGTLTLYSKQNVSITIPQITLTEVMS